MNFWTLSVLATDGYWMHMESFSRKQEAVEAIKNYPAGTPCRVCDPEGKVRLEKVA